MKFIVKKTFKTEVGIEIWFMTFDMGGGKAGGQLKSERIYEVINFPKYQQKY
jgi:hypothetical protein